MTETQKHRFIHRGHLVAIAMWTFVHQVTARAEIYRRDDVVCVLTRSTPRQKSSHLLGAVCYRAVRWIDRQLC